MLDPAYVARVSWMLASIVGALFLGGLWFLAVGDLKLRRAEPNAPRTSVLLAWQRVTFDSVLLVTMLVDIVISVLSFFPGNGLWILVGLDWDKISVVLLAIYLAWNRREVKQAGRNEFDAATPAQRAIGSRRY